MPNLKDAVQVLEDDLTLKVVTQAYTEIAALKLKQIRSGIERNRIFFDSISEVYKLVKIAVIEKKIVRPIKPKGVICVVPTSNHKFNGNVENELLRFFIVNTAKVRTERIVIGKTGAEFLKGLRYSSPYQVFLFKKDMPSQEEITTLVNFLSQYRQVLVFYPKFKTVMKQEPTIVDITTSVASKDLPKSDAEMKNFIFEPEIHKIIDFFDNQLLTLLFEQALFESELARTAARMLAMDQAQMNADTIIKNQRKVVGSAKRTIGNIRLLETISAFRSRHRGRRSE